MRRILIIKSSSMGDVVHALPVAYDIKQALPDSRIDWVVEEAFADIVELSPWIDGKIVTAFRRWRKHPLSAETRAEVARVKKALRENRYDLVIDLQGLVRSALVARWCGVKSVGYSRDTIREPLASFFYTETKRVPESLTPVKRYRTMASVCLGYDIDADHPIYGLKAKPLATRPAEGDYAVMAVNTSREEKLWARDRWIHYPCLCVGERCGRRTREDACRLSAGHRGGAPYDAPRDCVGSEGVRGVDRGGYRDFSFGGGVGGSGCGHYRRDERATLSFGGGRRLYDGGRQGRRADLFGSIDGFRKCDRH